MIRSITIFILASLVSTALAQRPSPDRLADLDGHYAGIRQRHINDLKRAPQQPETQQRIREETDMINGLRQKWAATPYRANFEKGLHDELTTPPRAPNTQPQTPNGQPIFTPPQQPLAIPEVIKLPLFIVAVWLSRKLWKAKPASAEPVFVDYDNLKVTLNPQEQKQYAEANKAHDAAIAKLDGELQKVAADHDKLKAKAAALAGRASALSTSLVADAVAELNQDAPDYQASIEALEAGEPATLAPWSNGLWEDFARQPKQSLPHTVRIGEYIETDTFPGETGVKAPYLVYLLRSAGPIIVQCDAASKQVARSIIQNIVLHAALAAPAEVRFSLLDSSGFGFSFAGALPHVRSSIGEPADQLPSIVSDIRRINQKVVGMRDSFASLTADERSGEMFEVVAVLDYPAAYQRQIGALENLALIAQSGPHAGCHLILEWNGTPGEADLTRFPNAKIIDVRNNAVSPRFDAVPQPAMIQRLLSASVAAKPKITVADWNKQIRPAKFFAESSTRKMETPMGERLRFWFGDDQNRTCAHAMIAGQSGSGKSVLLHVLITGLAARYSPAELRFILVDGKTGVEFKAYESLPHVDVACLNTSPAVARSVLADVVAEMDAR